MGWQWTPNHLPTFVHPSSISLHLTTASSALIPTPPVPILGVTEMMKPMEVKASTSKMPPSPALVDIEIASSKCCRIIPMPIPATPSRASSSPSRLPLVVVPKLVVPAHALLEQMNHPGGCKDYKCQLCDFQHTNRDCMLMHIWQHLKISIGCPMCSKGFQNMASIHKHRRKTHVIHIMEMENE